MFSKPYGGRTVTNIAIFYCKRLKDHSCVGCAKCYKAIGEKNGEFGRYEGDINLVSMTDCGDCPGLLVPRIKLVNEITNNIGRKIDVVHLGTCVELAIETAKCPINFNEVQKHIQAKFRVDTVLGTHSY